MSAEPSHPYRVLDVFTRTPLSGNQLAVFTQGEVVPSRLMLAAARELHLSETVFLLPGDAEADASVRIFTPDVELPFAGHPVLGAAFVVAAREQLSMVRLRTGAGVVPIVLSREHGDLVFGEMEQPLPTVQAFRPQEELLRALGGVQPVLPVEVYDNGATHVMVGLADAESVARLEPDMSALARLGPIGVSCFGPVQQTPAGEAQARVHSRVFCPGMGVPEDPATGSAAGPLALHLVRHGCLAAGETLEIIQGLSLQRPSQLFARVAGPVHEPERVTVGGSAVVVAQGMFRLS